MTKYTHVLYSFTSKSSAEFVVYTLILLQQIGTDLDQLNQIYIPLSEDIVQLEANTQKLFIDTQDSLRIRDIEGFDIDIRNVQRRLKRIAYLLQGMTNKGTDVQSLERDIELFQSQLDELRNIFEQIQQKNSASDIHRYVYLQTHLHVLSKKMLASSSNFIINLGQKASSSRNRAYSVGGSLGFIALLLTIVLSTIALRILSPIQQLTTQVQLIGKGDYSIRLPISHVSGQEITVLAREINHMAQAVLERDQSLQTRADELNTLSIQLEKVLRSISSGIIVVQSSTIQLINPVAQQDWGVNNGGTLPIPLQQFAIGDFEEVDIGETLSSVPDAEAVGFVQIDPPTVMMSFSVNDGPLAGKDGDRVTSREIRERLFREARTNVSIKVEDGDDSTEFKVSARGAMQVAVLVETMRREGFEVLVSRPSVIRKEIDGRQHEPFETLYLEVPDDCLGGCMQAMANRKGLVQDMSASNGWTRLEAIIPTRGLIGLEFEVLNITSGQGILSHLFLEYRPVSGEIRTRQTGTLVSMEKGESMTYALRNIETRGKLFIGAGEEVYEGMIVGENPRSEDLPVNPTKAKHVTNHRAAGSDKSEALTPPIRFSLERAIEYVGPDELVEVTPKLLRLRKRILDFNTRKREAKREAS